jgi:hypothetical protein
VGGGNRFLLYGECCRNERDLVAKRVVKDARDMREVADWIATALVSKVHETNS